MDAIKAINVKRQSAHKTSVPLTRRGNQPKSHKAALPTNATKASWRRCEYHNNTPSATTIFIKRASISAMQVQRMQPWTKRSSKRETSSRLGIFMPWISPDKNTKKNNKTRDNKLAKNNKNTAMWHMCHASCSQLSLAEQCRQSTDAIPSNNKTSLSCDDNNKDKNYHLHFDKKMKGGCVVVVFLHKSDHWQLSQVKRAKRKIHFLHSWMTISIFQTPSEWDLIPLMQTWIGLMTLRIWSVLTNDGPPLVELVKVLRVQNILKLYDRVQDYTILNNCPVWK